MSKTVHDFSARTIDGHEKPLADYRGKTLLIVNTASKCGLTPQYKGLEHLYRQYREQGLEVLGFPCNQFGAQEPGTEEEISQFCECTYGVTFPMFAKIDVNGDRTHPLYRYLKAEKPGLLGMQRIKWNFTKFLVNREGRVVKRYSPKTKPEAIAKDVQRLVATT